MQLMVYFVSISYVLEEDYKQKSPVELPVHFLTDSMHLEDKVYAEVSSGAPGSFSY